MLVYSESNVGPRSNNEDAFYYEIKDNELLAVICDGLGGQANGELAAQTVIDELKQLPLWSSAYIHHALNQAHRKCLNKYDGRATTATVLLLSDFENKIITHNKNNIKLAESQTIKIRRGIVFHTGDTRLYLIKKNKTIKQITEDQGYGHILYHCIGGERPLNICSYEFEKEEKDIILMSSDGYHDYDNLLRKNLVNLLLEFNNLENPANWLLNKVKEKTQDNNTVVIIK